MDQWIQIYIEDCYTCNIGKKCTNTESTGHLPSDVKQNMRITATIRWGVERSTGHHNNFLCDPQINTCPPPPKRWSFNRPVSFCNSTITSLFIGGTFYWNLSNFHEYLVQHSLKSRGTKDHFRWVKVPGAAPYWKACMHKEFPCSSNSTYSYIQGIQYCIQNLLIASLHWAWTFGLWKMCKML